MITEEDAKNTLVLLDRVQVTGVQEATVLAVLSNKFREIANAPAKEVTDGEDTPTATE